MQYAVQLYSLRDLPLDERVERVVRAGFDGVELVGLDPVETGSLSVVGAHVDVAAVEADPTGVVDRCRANGTTTVVVPSLDPAAFVDDAVEGTAARLDRLAGRVDDAGGRLCYHNHEFEFEFAPGIADDRRGPERGDAANRGGDGAGEGTPFDRLVAATTRLAFEVDVGWATAAGVDPVALLGRIGDRVPRLHLKDVRVDPTAPRGGVPVDLGRGDVDLRGCLRAAASAGIEWTVFEHDAPDDPGKSVRDAAAWLRSEPSGSR
jgi:sugar phosphate isomerase/epimerase